MNDKIVLFLLAVIFMFGTWTMEIGVIGMMGNFYPTNGFMSFDAWQVYHIGLYLQILSFVVLGILYAKRGGLKDEENVQLQAGKISRQA